MEILFQSFNFWVYVVLMMIGLYAMITKNNLIKKLIGMSIFQTAIILFFVSLSVPGTIEEGATIPIVDHSDHHSEKPADSAENPALYANPLPHVLMLTAIVVGVATLGVALAVTQVVFHDHGTVEENEILEKLRETDG